MGKAAEKEKEKEAAPEKPAVPEMPQFWAKPVSVGFTIAYVIMDDKGKAAGTRMREGTIMEAGFEGRTFVELARQQGEEAVKEFINGVPQSPPTRR